MKSNIKLTCVVALTALTSVTFASNDDFWNNQLQIGTFRLPPPPKGFKPEYLDLNNDGKIDAIKSVTRDSIPVLWLDDDGNMKATDIEGDLVNDCLLIDRDADGKYDLIVKYADINVDGKADLQLIAEYPTKSQKGAKGHYMYVLDTDNDQVFNYINWNKMLLECWEKNGISDFYTDYSGHSAFIKAHRTTNSIIDLRFNWENPFLFYDPDKDGLSEMTVRCCDNSVALGADKYKAVQGYKGNIDWSAIAVDLDNDNHPGNDFDLDMTVMFDGGGFNIKDQVHKLRNMRGLEAADKFFPDSRIRELTELIYPDHDAVLNLMFNAKWNKVFFTFDEDDDCGRWERVELYYPFDPFKIGSLKKGIDNHPQSDITGDRGEWDMDNSGNGNLYVSRFDGRIHLYGAEWGCWRIDQNTKYYQGYSRNWQEKSPEKFATVKYTDSDNNGFLDKIEYDYDGDKVFETTISLKDMGIDDKCEIIDISKLKYKDYQKLFSGISQNMWTNALTAVKVAKQFDLNPLWYSKMQHPASIREKYHDGYWLQLYLFKDLEHKFMSDKNYEMLKRLHLAYYSSNWSSLLK